MINTNDAANYGITNYTNDITTTSDTLNTSARTIGYQAVTLMQRDDNFRNNRESLNDSLIKVGDDYAYITSEGVARPVEGGIESDWTDQPAAGVSSFYRFTTVPDSTCPTSIRHIHNNTYNSLDDIKVNNKSIPQGNPINSYTLTACGFEGSIVYIDTFIDKPPTKKGNSESYYIGLGDGYSNNVFERWYTTDWASVVEPAGKIVGRSGYQSMKLVVENHIGKDCVSCYVSEIGVNHLPHLSSYYNTQQDGNRSTAVKGPNCTDDSKIFPTSASVDIFSNEVRDGLPLELNNNGGKIQPQQYKTGKQKKKGLFKKKKTTRTTVPIPCSELRPYTQLYKVTCNEMSVYPQGPPPGIQKCNTFYQVWHEDTVNTNIYVGNVGYVTPGGTIQHIAGTMLNYIDNDVNSLNIFNNQRVCFTSKQYKSINGDPRLKTVSGGNWDRVEYRKQWCANNKDCAGFHTINGITTFFKKTGVKCGEKLSTLNSKLPFTEDIYQDCITVWKSLQPTIYNPNNKFLKTDNATNTIPDVDNRGKTGITPSFYYNKISNYNNNVKNITGGCPTNITFSINGQVWYGYRNNGYVAEQNPAFICKKQFDDTTERLDRYLQSKLPQSVQYLESTIRPFSKYIKNTTNKIQDNYGFAVTLFNTKEGLTDKSKAYGDILTELLQSIADKTSVTSLGVKCILSNPKIKQGYAETIAAYKTGLLTQTEAVNRLTNICPPITDDTTTDDTTTDDTTADDTTTDDTKTDDTKTDDTKTNYSINDYTSGIPSDSKYSSAPLQYRETNIEDKIVKDTISKIQKSGASSYAYQAITNIGNLGHGKNTDSYEAMEEDSSVIMIKYFYDYGLWVLLTFAIIIGILIFGFDAVPMLNNKTVLFPLTVITGLISLVLLVNKYKFAGVLSKYLEKFIFYN